MKKALIIGTATVLLCGVGYSAGIGYYANKFQANTKFGSVDISNMTVAQAKEKIEKDIQKTSLALTENGKTIGNISLENLGVELDTDKVLEDTYQSQDPVGWLGGFFSSDVHDNVLTKNMKINDQLLTQELTKLGLGNDKRIAAVDASVEYANDKGYYVKEEKAGNQLDLTKVKAMIVEDLQKGSDAVEINTAYLAPAITKTDKRITDVMNKIEKVVSTKLTLQIGGDEVTIPREKIMEWVYFDEANDLVVDQEEVMAYLATLNEKYATYDKYREFHSTLQGTVTVEPGTLGWSIARQTESEQIIADLQKGGEIKREVNVVGTGYGSSGNDIGNSYVEVDVANQTMFIYVNGEMVLETAVVTGRPGTNTIVGAYSVWNKETPSVLKGFNPHTNRDYSQPVDYWIPFDDTGQGIHDANWQGSFGGDSYLYSGSLGCINTPPGVMPVVFEYVQLGMPVIVF